MTKKQFNKLFNGVAGPAHAGAPYPEFDEFAINESKFPRELRFKTCDIDFDEPRNLIHITWISQEEGDHEPFLKEILRCFREAIGHDGDIYVDIACRTDNDGEYFSYYF